MFFLDASESYLHHNASRKRQPSSHHYHFLTFQAVAVCIDSSFNRFRRCIFIFVLNTHSRVLHVYILILIKTSFAGCLFFAKNAYILTKIYILKYRSGDIKKKFHLAHVRILYSTGVAHSEWYTRSCIQRVK